MCNKTDTCCRHSKKTTFLFLQKKRKMGREKYCLGEDIRRELEEGNISVSLFARQVGVSRMTCYRIFSSTSLDTLLLMRISKALKKNFFKHYSDMCEVELQDNFDKH